MSQIAVENIKRPTETASRSTRGVAAAWSRFDGTVPSITDSLNVSSLTDNGSSNFTNSFTNAMGNANYTAADAAYSDYVTLSAVPIVGPPARNTTSGVAIGYLNVSGFTVVDVPYSRIVIYGDLA